MLEEPFEKKVSLPVMENEVGKGEIRYRAKAFDLHFYGSDIKGNATLGKVKIVRKKEPIYEPRREPINLFIRP